MSDLSDAITAVVTAADALEAVQASQPTEPTTDPLRTAVENQLLSEGWSAPLPAVEEPAATEVSSEDAA